MSKTVDFLEVNHIELFSLSLILQKNKLEYLLRRVFQDSLILHALYVKMMPLRANMVIGFVSDIGLVEQNELAYQGQVTLSPGQTMLKTLHYFALVPNNFSYNSLVIIHVLVLINQYRTGLFVSYSIESQSHQTVCQSAQIQPLDCQSVC